ncbi:hypothetical protein [Ralstonia phage phiITL-1]|uniref:Uncharacterized protein n=1 Tax=Ralstonia phage phiITL-1 TaxID=1597967 RepID=A0A0U1ZDW3_9CAUD|nr:hypothetical protein HOR02_gp47 [Ralstonia phage phiITL-1]AJT60831.1 hypothetical protein [Ralstonia phage phiITL-1]
MCFFKAPKVETPKVEPKPTITETSAPEPQALVIGDEKGAASASDDTTTKKGVGSLKIELSGAAAESGDANATTGANKALGGGPARAKKPVKAATSKGPRM